MPMVLTFYLFLSFHSCPIKKGEEDGGAEQDAAKSSAEVYKVEQQYRGYLAKALQVSSRLLSF